MESYQRGLAIEENDPLCRQGLQKVMSAINAGSGGDDEAARERAEHALADPEIQSILQDPIMRNVLSELQTNPQEAQKVRTLWRTTVDGVEMTEPGHCSIGDARP